MLCWDDGGGSEWVLFVLCWDDGGGSLACKDSSFCWTETEEFPVRRNREAHFFGSAESVRFRRMALSFPETKEWLLFIGFVNFFYETEE